MKYTLQRAAQIAAMLEPEMAKIDMHVAIGGSCVYRGGSNKDMDVFLYPHTRGQNIDRNFLVQKLKDLGFSLCKFSTEEATCVPDVWVTENEMGERIDFFFLDRHDLSPPQR